MHFMSDESFYEEGLEETEEEISPGSTRSAVILPKFYKWNVKDIYNFPDLILDYDNLDDLEKAINKARTALFVITDKLNEYERQERQAKTKYDRQYRREYLSSSEKTETAKRARAELKCEELENEWQTFSQLNAELIRLSHAMRLELQTLQAIGNNLRQQLKM